MQNLSKLKWSACMLLCAQQSNHLNKINPSTKFMFCALWNWWIAKLPLKFSLICKTSTAPNGNVSLGSLSVLFTVKAELHSVFVMLRGLKDKKQQLRGVCWGVGRFSGCRFVLMSEVSPEERLCRNLWQGKLENWQEIHPWALLAADSVMTVAVGSRLKRFAFFI